MFTGFSTLFKQLAQNATPFLLLPFTTLIQRLAEITGALTSDDEV